MQFIFLRRRATAALRTFIALLVATTTLAAAGTAGAGEGYRLGVMDKLRIRVVEWQTAEGAFRSWDAVSGDYSVGPSGSISLPFIGETAAVGKTTAEISKAIGDALQQKFGLIDRPDAAVELAEFRPVYLAGDVETPGAYAYGPGLTVLKAISLAGGLRRSSESRSGAERNFVNAQGNYKVYVEERNRLYAKRARLVAEAGAKGEIAVPTELDGLEDATRLIAAEKNVMQARENRMRLQITQLNDLKALLEKEIVSLDKKSETQERQVELARSELKGIGNLADRGLVLNSRVLAIEQRIADIEGKVVDLDTASLRAKQDINKASQDATNLANDHAAEIAESRQAVEAEIAGLTLQIDMYRGLMAEALANAPEAARTSAPEAPRATYSIVRGTGRASKEIAAEETAEIQPGDVIKVTLLGLPID